MRQTIISAFDMGISFGVNDSILTVYKDELSRKTGLAFSDVEVPVGINLLIGRGLRIKLAAEYLDRWKEAALEKARATKEYKACEKLFDMVECSNLYMDVHALGICYLRLDINGISEEDYDVMMLLYRSFEFSAYESFSAHLIDILQKIKAFFLEKQDASKITALSKRFELSEIDKFDLIPGFVCINVCDEKDDRKKVLKIAQEFEGLNKYEKLDTNDGIFYLGWASAVACDHLKNDERNIFLYRVALVYYEASKAFDKYFTVSLTGLVNSQGSTMRISEEDISYLKILTNSVVQLTSFIQTSESICDKYFFEAFEKLSKIGQIHARIRETSVIFADVQNSLLNQRNQRREKMVNRFVLVITLLTFISVISDIIGTVDYFNGIIPDPLNRILALFLPTLLFGLLFFIITRIYLKQE